jgi:GTP cyclohydrolase I
MIKNISAFLEDNSLKGPDFDDTPMRVARFWNEFLYPEEPTMRTFPSDATDMVTLSPFTTWGMCPHHLLPVRYTVHISYRPDGKVLGISKLPRVVKWLLRTLPLQEDLPHLICQYIMTVLAPKEVAAVVEGMHLCMVMRGVRVEENTKLKTSFTMKRTIYEILY